MKRESEKEKVKRDEHRRAERRKEHRKNRPGKTGGTEAKKSEGWLGKERTAFDGWR